MRGVPNFQDVWIPILGKRRQASFILLRIGFGGYLDQLAEAAALRVLARARGHLSWRLAR